MFKAKKIIQKLQQNDRLFCILCSHMIRQLMSVGLWQFQFILTQWFVFFQQKCEDTKQHMRGHRNSQSTHKVSFHEVKFCACCPLKKGKSINLVFMQIQKRKNIASRSEHWNTRCVSAVLASDPWVPMSVLLVAPTCTARVDEEGGFHLQGPTVQQSEAVQATLPRT
jgi:hypothetical protein